MICSKEIFTYMIPLNANLKQDNSEFYIIDTFKADMKSYKSLETAAIFYSSEPFLKQVIS